MNPLFAVFVRARRKQLGLAQASPGLFRMWIYCFECMLTSGKGGETE